MKQHILSGPNLSLFNFLKDSSPDDLAQKVTKLFVANHVGSTSSCRNLYPIVKCYEFIGSSANLEFRMAFTSLPSNLTFENLSISRTGCGICHKKPKDPCYLPCSHVFCRQCLIDSCCSSDDPNTIICSVCGNHSPKPHDGLASLPSSKHRRHSRKVSLKVLTKIKTGGQKKHFSESLFFRNFEFAGKVTSYSSN